MTGEIDLFGNPYVEKPVKRGRPPHEVTKESRNRVSMLVVMGWTSPRIASTMGVTLPTLHKYYFYELRQREAARDRFNLQRLMLTWKLAEAGNVGALKEFGKLMDRNDQMEAEREMSAAPDQPNDKAEAPKQRLGKKVLDAQQARMADADLMAELEMEAANLARH